MLSVQHHSRGSKVGNKLKFNDIVSFSLTDQSLIKVKDDWSGAFVPQGEGQDTSLTMPNARGLHVRIAATHSGIITRNNGFYLPEKMSKGASTFVADYGKPILLHHNDREDAVGRVVQADYIDTSGALQDNFDLVKGIVVRDRNGNKKGVINEALIKDFCGGRMPHGMQVDTVVSLFRDSVLLDNAGYSGLGYIQLVGNIVDPEAIQKLMDGRYLTGSVGATTDQAICSVCRQDWTDGGPCEHRPGAIYDGAKCFIIAGSLDYDEYSFVNAPADRHSKVLQLHYNDSVQDIEIAQDFRGSLYEVQLSFPQYDETIQEDAMTARKKKKAEKNEQEVKVQDSVEEVQETPEPANNEETQVQDEVTIEFESEVETDVVFLTRILANLGKELSEEDETRLYEMVLEELVLADEERGSPVENPEEWKEVMEKMEDFAAQIDGEDEELQIEDEAVEDKEGSQDKPGGSNAGKYKTKGPFCGPAGGAPKGSYPVNTSKRAKAALSYAKHAPNPSGIRNCVCRHYPSLPSCKSKDCYLPDQARRGLPLSAFCAPGRIFPVVDQDHFRATMMFIDRYSEVGDWMLVRTNVLRKGRAHGWTLQDNVEEPVAEEVTSEEVSGPDFKDLLTQVKNAIPDLEEGERPSLAEEELEALKSVLTALVALVGKENIENAVVATEVAADPACMEAMADEVIRHEETICTLRDELDALRKEYNSLFKDMEALQDAHTETTSDRRKVKEGLLTVLRTISNEGVVPEGGFNVVELSDEALSADIARYQREVDMVKIADKLGDGMAREPTETVDNPLEPIENAEQNTPTNQKRFSAEELARFQDHVYRLVFAGRQAEANDLIDQAIAEGRIEPNMRS